jgi:CheY-like chemotaxis protein
VIKGEATEIIDVSHFLPIAFTDWFRGKDLGRRSQPQSPLSRRLAILPQHADAVLRAAGYEVTAAGGGEEALAIVRSGKPSTSSSPISKCRRWTDSRWQMRFAATRTRRYADHRPIINARSGSNREGRKAGFHDFVAKFDRQGLVAALKDTAMMATRQPEDRIMKTSEDQPQRRNRIRHRDDRGTIVRAPDRARARRVHAGSFDPVPLASEEIAGVLNLRGRIVTAIDMRCRLGLPQAR